MSNYKHNLNKPADQQHDKNANVHNRAFVAHPTHGDSQGMSNDEPGSQFTATFPQFPKHIQPDQLHITPQHHVHHSHKD